MNKEVTTSNKHVTPTRALGPFEEMDHWIESAFPRGWVPSFRLGHSLPGGLLGEAHVPKIDVIDRDEEVVVRAEVPGVDRDDLELSVSDNTVTIRGETKQETKEEKGDYHRSEIRRGAFARTVMLPGAVNAERSKARFKDGVLELTMPKVENAKRHTIEIE